MTPADALAILVVFVAAPINWYVAVILVKLVRASGNGAILRVQAVAWVSLSVIVTVFAIVFVNNGMAHPILDLEATRIFTRGTLLVFSVVPAAYWLRAIWRRA